MYWHRESRTFADPDSKIAYGNPFKLLHVVFQMEPSSKQHKCVLFCSWLCDKKKLLIFCIQAHKNVCISRIVLPRKCTTFQHLLYNYFIYNNNHLAYRIDVFTLSVCLKCCLAYLSISFDSFVVIIVLKMLMPSVLTSTHHIHWIPEIVGEPVVSRNPFSRGRVITQRNGKRRIY